MSIENPIPGALRTLIPVHCAPVVFASAGLRAAAE
jgi:hypothetical protein